jgi:hypothetical protein
VDPAYDVFVSYSHADRDWVRDWLLPRLEQAQLHVCVDTRDFDVGVSSLANMQNAVERSRKTLLVLTPQWRASQWADFKSLLAQSLDPAGLQQRVVPLMLQKTQLTGRLAIFTYADFTEPKQWDMQLARVIRAIKPDAPAAPVPLHVSAHVAPLTTKPVVAIDTAHGQKDWRGFTAGVGQAFKGLAEFAFQTVGPGQALTSVRLNQFAVLVLALPLKAPLADEEIINIHEWVTTEGKGLLMLSHYSGDAHHGSNLNSLARLFGFEFAEELVLPLGRSADVDARYQAFDSGQDRGLVVIVEVPDANAHPIVGGLQKIALLSACGLTNISSLPAFVLNGPPSAIMRPKGPKDAQGWMLQIQQWLKEGEGSVPLLAAWHSGLGKVVAVATWKIVLPAFTGSGEFDNRRFLANAISWLAS